MGNKYSCDVHDHHSTYDERDMCIKQRKTETQIQALKLQYKMSCRCNSGHAHRDMEEVRECHNFQLKMRYIELQASAHGQTSYPKVGSYPDNEKVERHPIVALSFH